MIEQHATSRVSRAMVEGKGLHFALTRAFRKHVEGPNILEAPGTQMTELEMNQWDFEVSFSFGF